MAKVDISLPALALKAAIVHTVTYFAIGSCAAAALDYAHAFSEPGLAGYMRGLDDPMVRGGPLFQPLRGALFGVAFYPLRDVLFDRPRGWAVAWLLLVVIGIVSPFGPAPGSVEGFVYTTVAPRRQMLGWLEVVPQAFALSTLLFFWVRNPQQRWLTWLLGITFCAGLVFSILGVVLEPSASGM